MKQSKVMILLMYQKLVKNSTEHNIEDISGNSVYHGISYDDEDPTLIIVYFEDDDNVQEIRAIYPLKDDTGDEIYRFFVDKKYIY